MNTPKSPLCVFPILNTRGRDGKEAKLTIGEIEWRRHCQEARLTGGEVSKIPRDAGYDNKSINKGNQKRVQVHNTVQT